MCYTEDCEDYYQPPVDPTPEDPTPEDPTPDTSCEDCDSSSDSGNTNPGGETQPGGETNPGGETQPGETTTPGGNQNPNDNCCCDDRTDTGGTKPGGETQPGGETNPGGTTTPGGGHICICDCDDCADGICGITRYYKPGDSFCLYTPNEEYYAWSSEPSIIVVGPDGKVHIICEGSAYICLRSKTDPTFRRCWRVVATNNPPTGQGGSGTNPGGGSVIAVTSVGISGPDYGYVSDRLTMSHTVYPTNATNKTVYWTSTNSSVARFNTNGVLRCLSPGKTIARVTTVDGNHKACKSVTVYAKCEKVTIESASNTMAVGTTQHIRAVASPSDTYQEIGYISSNSEIATVNANGLVTALKPGEVRIVAYHDDNAAIYDTLDIVVTPSVTGISVLGPSYGIVGRTVAMGYQARPSGAVIKNVQWRSQYPAIASVDTNGIVTCHKIGQTCIFVTTQDGRYTNWKTLTVYDPCTEVTTNLQRTAMIVGATQTLNAAALPRTAMQSFSYSSSNSNIVSVSQHGILTAQAHGSAEITVTSVTNPDVQTSVTVTVYENPLSNIRANIENGRFRLENAHLEKWICSTSDIMPLLHLAADTTNYQDTFDFKEIDGYYTISLTNNYGTFYIGEQIELSSSTPIHTVIMDEIACPQCELPYHFLWEIFETDSGYSIRNAESQYFLCGTGDILRTVKLDMILDQPAVYPCFWNIVDPASNELDMPINVNQKHKVSPNNFSSVYNDRIDNFNENGCMACSYADIVGYYNNFTEYTVREIIENNEWWKWNSNGGYYCAYMPSKQIYKVKFTGMTCSCESAYLKQIKKNIDAGKPVMLHFGNPGSHYVVAYKYIKNCEPTPEYPMSNVYVLDPVNLDTTDPVGSIRTAYDAQQTSECGTVTDILLSESYPS